MRTLLVSVLLIGCGPGAAPTDTREGSEAAAAPSSGEDTTCTETYDITSTPGTTFEDIADSATLPWPQPGVRFTATVVRVGAAVRVEGTLVNETDARVSVDYLTGGAMGVSTNPFQVDIDTAPREATGPEIYPSPRRATLPPGGRITYRTDRCPLFPARVRWTFSPWHGPAVQGDVLVP